MFRAGLYARVSTHDQQTLAMQSRARREYAARRGRTVAWQVREVNSGAAKRQSREKLLEAARRRAIDVVLVWRLGRWGRSMTDLLATLQEREHLGAGFVSLTEALDLTTPAGRAMAGLLAIFAESEREILRERTKAGLAHARAAGKRLGRPATAAAHAAEVRKLHRAAVSKSEIARRLQIGRTSVRRILQPISPRNRLNEISQESAAPVVHVALTIFAEAAAGKRPSEIAATANAREYRTKAGGPWTARQVVATLRNPVYVGYFRDGSRVRPGCHQPIVELDLFEATGRELDLRRTTGPKSLRYGLPWPLRGKILCGCCGRPLTPHSCRRGSKIYRYYRCRAMGGGRPPCGYQVQAGAMEFSIARQYRNAVGKPEDLLDSQLRLVVDVAVYDPGKRRIYVSWKDTIPDTFSGD